MKNIAYNATKSFVSVTFSDSGKTEIVKKDTHPELYSRVMTAIRDGDENKVRNLLCLDIAVSEVSGGEFEIKDGQVLYNGMLVHNAVTKKIIECVMENLPYANLKAFLGRILNQLNPTVLDELYLFLDSNESMPIMDDGAFLAYRVVQDNYYSKHRNPDGTRNRNMIGDEVTFDRDAVDPDRDNTCSDGLHFCSLHYVPFYGYSDSDRVMIVKINPEDVVTIPNDYNNSKGRCCYYEVVGEVEDYGKDGFTDRASKTIRETAYADVDFDEDDEDEYDFDDHFNETNGLVNQTLEEDLYNAMNGEEVDEDEEEDYFDDIFEEDDDSVPSDDMLDDSEDVDMVYVNNIIKSQLGSPLYCETTARRVSKSTKPYINVKKVLDIAEDLGYLIDRKEVISQSIIKKYTK